MVHKIYLWMKKYGFWPTWLVTSLVMLLFAVLISSLAMILVIGDVRWKGLIVSILISSFFIMTVQLMYMRLVYDLEEARSRLTDLIRVDELTGAANRRCMMEKLKNEFDRSRRTGIPFLLISFDMDDFKSINDRHGHFAGDQILIQVVRSLMSRIRSIDTLARMGGDEFSLIAPSAKESEGPEMARRIGMIIHNLKFTFEDEIVHPYASIGWAAWAPHMKDPEELLQLADKALYAEKQRKGIGRTAAGEP